MTIILYFYNYYLCSFFVDWRVGSLRAIKICSCGARIIQGREEAGANVFLLTLSLSSRPLYSPQSVFVFKIKVGDYKQKIMKVCSLKERKRKYKIVL